MEVKLYSTHCPMCNVLEKKLQQKNIFFEEINDIELMKKKGYYYELVNAQKLTYQSNNEQATLQD